MKFLNTATGAEENFDNDTAREALSNPIYQPVDLKSFQIKSANGELYEADDIAKARAFVSAGHGSFYTPFDAEKEKWEKKGIIGDAAAVGLGALSSVTFGATDIAARALGVDQTVKAIREASPIATGVGEVAGLFVPGFGEAKLAELAGKATIKGVEKIAAKSGTQLAENALISRAGEAIARGTTLGARQGITEVSLDDIPLTVESAASTVVKDALLGGALDLGFSMGAPAIKALAKKGWTYVPGSSTATELANRTLAKAASKMPFGSSDEEALFNLIKKDTRVEYQNFMKDFEKNAKATTNSLTELKNGYRAKAGEAESVARDAFKAATIRDPQALDTVVSGVQNVIKDTDRIVIDEALSNKAKSGAKRLRALLDQLQDDAGALSKRISTPAEMNKTIDKLFEARTFAKAVKRDMETGIQTELIFKKLDGEQINGLVSKLDGIFDSLGQTKDMVEADRLYAISAGLDDFVSKMVGKKKSQVASPLKVANLLKRGKIGDTPIEEFIARIKADEGILSTALGNGTTSATANLEQMSKLAGMSKRIKAINAATGQYTGRSLMPALAGFGLGGIGPVGAAIGVGLTPLLNPSAYLKAVDAVENIAGKLSKRMAAPPTASQLATAQGLGEKVISAVKQAARTRKTMVLDEAAMGVFEAMQHGKNYPIHLSNLDDVSGTTISPSMERLQKMHPELPGRAGIQYGLVQNYLRQQAPMMRASYNKPGEQRLPTVSEMQTYAQKLVAASDPWGVLQRAASKSLIPNNTQMNVIRDLYPQIYQRIYDSMPGTEIGGIADIQSMHDMAIETPESEVKSRNIKFGPQQLTSIQRATMR